MKRKRCGVRNPQGTYAVITHSECITPSLRGTFADKLTLNNGGVFGTLYVDRQNSSPYCRKRRLGGSDDQTAGG